eukprot:3860307-Rhodomonas_salina.1
MSACFQAAGHAAPGHIVLVAPLDQAPPHGRRRTASRETLRYPPQEAAVLRLQCGPSQWRLPAVATVQRIRHIIIIIIIIMIGLGLRLRPLSRRAALQPATGSCRRRISWPSSSDPPGRGPPAGRKPEHALRLEPERKTEAVSSRLKPTFSGLIKSQSCDVTIA